MKVLFVVSVNNHEPAAFVQEQADALRNKGCEVEIFGLTGKGIWGYLSNVERLKKVIEDFKPQIIHAHYGLSGLMASLQHKTPVITTYHGSDINNPKILRLSRMAIRHSTFNIFVSQKLVNVAKPRKNFAVIPCGVNTGVFKPMDKQQCRKALGLEKEKKYVLFASSFNIEVKNPQLAKDAVALLPNVTLLELKGYTREQVAQLLNAVDVLLLTSHSEGSPQVVKEALACGCPIVSADVGDVKDVVSSLEGCYIAESNAQSFSNELKKALTFDGKTEGHKRIAANGLENRTIAERLLKIYSEVSECK